MNKAEAEKLFIQYRARSITWIIVGAPFLAAALVYLVVAQRDAAMIPVAIGVVVSWITTAMAIRYLVKANRMRDRIDMFGGSK